MRRLLVYDRTCPRLSRAWAVGARLYRSLGRLDAAQPVASWAEALAWLGDQRDPIAELQYWGHGKWGTVMVDRDPLDASALVAGHAYHRGLEAVRERLAPGALVWLRTCETFGAHRGLDFAQRLASWLGARVAGHTYVIGFHQSGLHALDPGVSPDWSPDEGLAEGTADAPLRAKWSTRFSPRTITCLTGRVPERWVNRAS